MKPQFFVALAVLLIGLFNGQAQDDEKIQPKKEMTAFLGVSSRKTSAQEQLAAKCAVGTGIVAQHVVPGSPAEEGGVRKGDVMELLDNQLLINPEQLRVLIQSKKPQTTMVLTVKRDGEKVAIPITLGQTEKRRHRGGNMQGIRDMLKGLNIQGGGLENMGHLLENLEEGDFEFNDDGKGNMRFKTRKNGPVQIDINRMIKNTVKGAKGAKARVFTLPMGKGGMMLNGRGNDGDDEL